MIQFNCDTTRFRITNNYFCFVHGFICSVIAVAINHPHQLSAPRAPMRWVGDEVLCKMLCRTSDGHGSRRPRRSCAHSTNSAAIATRASNENWVYICEPRVVVLGLSLLAVDLSSRRAHICYLQRSSKRWACRRFFYCDPVKACRLF